MDTFADDHELDRELTFDECEAIGLDGTGRDGNPLFPYTLTSVMGMYIDGGMTAEQEAAYTGTDWRSQ